MEKKFVELFAETLEIDRELNLNDKFRDYPEWDSLAYLSVLAMIDEEYEVIIEGKEFKTLQTLGDIVETIKKHQE